jgi:hypothetical protein
VRPSRDAGRQWRHGVNACARSASVHANTRLGSASVTVVNGVRWDGARRVLREPRRDRRSRNAPFTLGALSALDSRSFSKELDVDGGGQAGAGSNLAGDTSWDNFRIRLKIFAACWRSSNDEEVGCRHPRANVLGVKHRKRKTTHRDVVDRDIRRCKALGERQTARPTPWPCGRLAVAVPDSPTGSGTCHERDSGRRYSDL